MGDSKVGGSGRTGRTTSTPEVAFDNEQDASAYEASVSSEWRRSLTYQENQAFRNYINGGAGTINGLLRGDVPLSGQIATVVEGVDSALQKAYLSDNLVVYRGIPPNVARSYTRLKRGESIPEKGYLSTTTMEGTARGFANRDGSGYVLRIHAPEGSHGAFIGNLTNWGPYGFEHEFLFPRNSHLRLHHADHRNRVLDMTLES